MCLMHTVCLLAVCACCFIHAVVSMQAKDDSKSGDKATTADGKPTKPDNKDSKK